MKKQLIIRTLLAGCLLTATPDVHATPSLTWDATDLGGGNWQYAYTITNDLNEAIDSFSIDFAFGLYSALQVDGQPAGWASSYAFDPYSDNTTGASNGALWGFADSGSEIAAGASLSGFVVSFTWLPGDDEFSPLSNEVTTLGDQAFSYTTVAGPQGPTGAPAPEPATFLLFGSGLSGLATLARKRNVLHG